MAASAAAGLGSARLMAGLRSIREGLQIERQGPVLAPNTQIIMVQWLARSSGATRRSS
jgi:hypothetical protein